MHDYDIGLKAKIKGCRRLRDHHPDFASFQLYLGQDTAASQAIKDLFYGSALMAWYNDPWIASGASGRVVRHTGLHLHYADYRGRVYTRFEAAQHPSNGPGWFIQGRHATEYADEKGVSRLVAVCGWPEAPLRKFPTRNGLARAGWKTKAQAQAVCYIVNRGHTCQPRGTVLTLDDCTVRPLWGQA